jgi:uncharacterized protein (TIGR02996 family)
MDQQEALLRAIIEAPDDDGPRFTYADWLEKSGDSDRANFIRVQCALDKMPTQAPERPALLAREKELLELHGWSWAEECGTQISEWVYRRGFIERVQMCLETSAEEILALLRKAPIRHIRDITQFYNFNGVVEALPHLDRLTGLEFWYLSAFEDPLVARLLASPHLCNLRTLILHHDRNGNLVHEKVLIDGLASPYRANLEELGVNIDGCWRGPSRGILKAIAQSPYLRKLRKLNLTNAGDEGNRPEMDLETARCLGESLNLAGLEELDMGRTSFPIPVWDEVLKWPWLTRLRWLRLHYARQVQPSSIRTLAKLEQLPPYRKAFEQRVGTVDWHTAFISPWDGNTCWRGLTWRDRPRRLLFGMNRFVRAGDYTGLEAEYRRQCAKLAGDRLTAEIDELPFNRYKEELHEGFQRAVANLSENRGRAIFLRLRPDIRWKGEFHVQARDYPKMEEPHEEPSYEGPVAEFPGPGFPEAARIYTQYPLYAGIQPSGPALYLLARTIAAFGRCLSLYDVPAPVYFSCMYVVFWMKGGSSP